MQKQAGGGGKCVPVEIANRVCGAELLRKTVVFRERTRRICCGRKNGDLLFMRLGEVGVLIRRRLRSAGASLP